MNKFYQSGRQKVNFNDICFWIITIDIFFLPYLPFVAISGSVLFVALWLLNNILHSQRKELKDKEKIFFILMLFIMLISTLCNLFYTGNVHFNTSFSTASKRLVQYCLSFGVYFFYKDYFKRHSITINKIILIFIIYVAIFAILYNFFPMKYAIYKYYITPSDNHTMRYLSNMVSYRFNYLWVDPNNVAYLIAGISAWYLFNTKNKFTHKMILMIFSIYIIFSTQSIGGLIMLISVVILYIMYFIIKFLKSKFDAKTIFYGAIIVVCLLSIYKFSPIGQYIKNTYISNINNIKIRSENYSNMTIGGRGEDIIKAINYLNPILLIVGSGNEGFSYEIGHFYWIGMYGLISYLIFVWIVFRKIKEQSFEEYIWILPFFVGFTLNIGIGEFKWLSILFFLLAYSRKNAIKIN